MTHAAFIALLNNHTLFNSVNLQQITVDILNSLEQNISEFITISLIVLYNLQIKYIETFGDNYILPIILGSIIIFIYQNSTKISLNRVIKLENQVQFMKKRLYIQDGNVEFLLEDKKNNELKIATLKRQVQKLIKDNKIFA